MEHTQICNLAWVASKQVRVCVAPELELDHWENLWLCNTLSAVDLATGKMGEINERLCFFVVVKTCLKHQEV